MVVLKVLPTATKLTLPAQQYALTLSIMFFGGEYILRNTGFHLWSSNMGINEKKIRIE